MKILVPTAGPEAATANADYIVAIGKRLGAELAVIHILDLAEYDEGREALNIFDQAGQKAGVKVETYIREGNVVPSIVEFAEELDVSLIIMGASHGRIVAEWIVSQILAKTNIPIVIIPYGVDLIIPPTPMETAHQDDETAENEPASS